MLLLLLALLIPNNAPGFSAKLACLGRISKSRPGSSIKFQKELGFIHKAFGSLETTVAQKGFEVNSNLRGIADHLEDRGKRRRRADE
jgi:hypothetical protein